MAVTTAVVVLAAAGCVQVPESGPVVGAGSEGRADEPPGVFIDPKPPAPGDNPADIVTGFLDAMTATPIQTNAAKAFLTPDAQAAWEPEAETITYSEASPPRGGLRVSVRLDGAQHLDGRGSFLGRLPAGERSLTFPMASEDGEWRIARAPDALIVPDSWFEQRFRQVSLYFFDPSARILVPEPVFVPRGEQLATALTSALLRGPGPALQGISRSFIPEGLSFGLSVPVSDEGVADLSLRGFSGRLTPDASEQMLAQLAWTLRQEPAIEALRVSVGGRPVTLAGGESLFDVDEQGARYDPTVLDASTLLYGLGAGRLVSGPPDSLSPVDGPLGVTRLGLRSVAVDLTADRVAGISAGGHGVLMAPVRNESGRVDSVVSGARSLLRPSWDFSDTLWLVDNTPGGARVSYVTDRNLPVPLRVPGVTGRRVSHFTVSRDGSRLVAVVPRPGGDRVMLSRIVHDAEGRVVRAKEARRVAWQGDSRLEVRDIGWSSPTSLAVLHRLARQLYQVRTIPVDGSPPGPDSLLTTLPGQVTSLVASPVQSEGLFVATRSGLLDLTQDAPATALDPRIRSLDYVG
ncbi:LpqB family beta-propeller domain-containing protein [Nocardioides sp.]|uniref:LpqB family beta-propeller domain-containing protein n=1 Tax=Nocardioides sp. TaxID=35761 RepID=UPI002D7FBFA5|nr:LpqB family beta-propeller domain-containing protein [Nocardioides sp.]HET8961250.1 LpqB family beta-propeller domain-containing protein [Nocardioides sp.]